METLEKTIFLEKTQKLEIACAFKKALSAYYYIPLIFGIRIILN